ncbi:MAG: hypothetical protein WB630_05030 [Candidatus Acidiferrales bacterium]
MSFGAVKQELSGTLGLNAVTPGAVTTSPFEIPANTEFVTTITGTIWLGTEPLGDIQITPEEIRSAKGVAATFSNQCHVEPLERAGLGSSEGRRTLEQVFEIVIAILVPNCPVYTTVDGVDLLYWCDLI